MEGTARQQALRRLSYIEGHLAGIRRMVEEDRRCAAIMRQTYAVRHAIQKMELLVLRAYLDTCVVPAVRIGGSWHSMRDLAQLHTMLSLRRERDGNARSTP